MKPPFADRNLGEYHLEELLGENAITRTWLADQVSVARKVLVEELKDASQQDAFLADVRAKAAVDHPLIGSVYEAISEPGLCFCAHELLPGATLEARKSASEIFLPARLAHILRRICDANLQYEALDHAASRLDLDAVHLDAQGVIRIKNLAIAGPRDPQRSQRDTTHLGTAMVPLVAREKPGSTRFLTLLSWMRGEGVDAPITWTQVRECCEQIEQQLAEPLPPSPATRFVSSRPGKKNFALVAIVSGIIFACLTSVVIYLRPPKPQPIVRAILPGAITIPAGKHPTPDGTTDNLPAFQISAHEVTLGEYAEFLEMLGMLSKSERQSTFDHESQPAEKLSHQPADWEALIAAAKANDKWQGKPVTLDSPVIGIDWWDATAYAEWQKGRLPTQEEWFAALSHQLPQPRRLIPGTWAPVNSEMVDRTPAGLLAMSGSVSEWTSSPAPNPANPLGERLWVLMGGSYLKPGTNALTREWIADRSLRRQDVGFRLVFEPN